VSPPTKEERVPWGAGVTRIFALGSDVELMICMPHTIALMGTPAHILTLKPIESVICRMTEENGPALRMVHFY
jgi:hypothetical protein